MYVVSARGLRDIVLDVNFALFKLFATIIDNHFQFRRRAWNPVSSLGTHAFAFQETVVEQFVEELTQISMAA